MEELGQGYGYLLYRTEASWDADEERIRIIDGRDRAQLLSLIHIFFFIQSLYPYLLFIMELIY